MTLVGIGFLLGATAEYLQNPKQQLTIAVGAVAVGFALAGTDELWHGKRGDAEDLLGLSVSLVMMTAALHLWKLTPILATITGILGFALALLSGI